jgi:hypothetical protein
MIRAYISLAVLCLSACGRTHSTPAVPKTSNGRDTTALVVVDRPTVIGFFPPAKDSAEANEDGYSEGQAHIGFALQDAEACLGRDSAQIIFVVDTGVRIQHGSRIDTIRFSRIDSLSYGAYLIGPGAQPLLVNAYGPSQLIPAVSEAIPEYFHRRPCSAK